MSKVVLSAQDLLEDSFRLGLDVLESGFKPTMIIAIWRGGTPVGMAVQEILAYCGVESDHIAIRTSSYMGVDQRGSVAVHGLNYIIKKICHDDRVLIVDDVFDTGNTIVAVIEELTKRARGNTPDDIRVAVPWFKPSRNETSIVPDYLASSMASRRARQQADQKNYHAKDLCLLWFEFWRSRFLYRRGERSCRRTGPE